MALPINIDDLINAKTVEHVRIEFKKGWNPYSILKTVCAFANDLDEYGGGYIIIGIEEKDGTPILPPVGIEQKDLDTIQREFFKLCQDNIRQNIFPPIEPIEFQGKWIIVIWITPGEERPYCASDSPGKNAKMKIFVRHGAITKEADKEQEIRLRALAAFKHFDDRINPKASVGDLDLGLILSYLQEIKSQLYTDAQKMPFIDLCSKMQIVRGPKENIRPLNIGLLLFSKNPEVYFEGCRTNLIELENEEGTRYSEKQFIGPVHIQIRQIMEYLRSNVIKQYVRKDAGRSESIRFFNYPYQALEEAIVNALYHRSYENPTPNEVRIYKTGADRRIEILSYPGPMPPIDETALVQLRITARNYRNIKLGDWLKNLRLAEKYATGIPTMLGALRLNGSPEPILSTDASRSYFLVVFRIHPDAPVENIDSATAVEAIALSDRQQKILERLTEEPMTQVEITNLFGKEADDDLNYLLENEMVKVKSNKEPIYFITTTGRQSLKNSF